jgi:DNA-binding beta-propeller fold protein YncE
MFLALAAVLAGCASAPAAPDAAPVPGAALAWPAPPAPARVRFLKQVAKPADWGVARTGFSGFVDRVTGQKPFHFVRPTGVVEREGTLYIADPGAQALVILEATADRERVVDRIDREALASPVAVALGPGDTIFLADSALRKVLVLGRAGQPRGVIGGDGRLGRPAGLAYDARADRLYVADSQAHRIVVFDAAGKFLGSFGRNGAAPGEFNFPTHLALTTAGDLVVTDTLNYRVQVVGRNGEPRLAFGRVGDGSGDFASPKGVAVDVEGNLYVVDALFDAVQVFDARGTLLLGFGSRGTQAGRFWLPNGIFIGADDRIYVADAYNQRISVFERVKP